MSQPSKQSDVSRPGKVIAGRYAVERVLGMGGMGMVLIAQHLELGQRVVLKLLRPEVTQDSDVVARFQREARATAGIQSEHVVRLFDVARLDDGTPYMVMEYLDGADLDKVLRARGPLPFGEVADYILQACEAVAEAHARGIVHRDLKPANLFLTQRSDGTPLVKVLDFGISKFTGSVSAEIANSLTSTSDVLGSPQYMSPEQIRSSKAVDSRTDIWALGVILHRLLTKRQPFEAPTLGLFISNILNEPPTPLRDHRPDAPTELEELILGCLEKDVALRYQSVADVARGLVPFAPARAVISFERIVRILRGVGVIVERSATSGAAPLERPQAPAPAPSGRPAAASSATPAWELSELTRTEVIPSPSEADPASVQRANERDEQAFNRGSKLKAGGLLRTVPLAADASSPASGSVPSPRGSSPSSARVNAVPLSQQTTKKTRRPPPPAIPRSTSSLPVIIGGLAFGATVSLGLYVTLTAYNRPHAKDAASSAPSASALAGESPPPAPPAPSARPLGSPLAPSGATPVEASGSAAPSEASAHAKAPPRHR